MLDNPLLDTDSYKAGHYLQYPPATERISAYLESRGGAFAEVLFFGLQTLLQGLAKPITLDQIDEAHCLFAEHGQPFNLDGWLDVLNRHGGRLPVEIQAVPEGFVVPSQNVLVQVVNTDPALPWLTQYIETALLRAVWFPSSVATLTWQIRRTLWQALETSCDDPAAVIDRQLHDFGARGMASQETAALAGCAHLVNFSATDNLAGVMHARRFYQAPMAGRSMPAAEHSTIVSWGRGREKDAYERLIQCFGHKGGQFAALCDAYDTLNAVDSVWGEQLKRRLLDSGATLWLRPDSADPTEMLPTVIGRLYDRFGGRTNAKGYRVLNPAVRLIVGEGITPDTIAAVTNRLLAEKFSTENVAFGLGGAALQTLTRDTARFAMKTSAVQVNGLWSDAWKKPDAGPARAATRGRLALTRDEAGRFRTVRMEECLPENNLLRPVFRDGRILMKWSLDEIREKARQHETR